jgi:hypothetical protein
MASQSKTSARSNRNGHYLAVLGLVIFGLYAFLLLPGASNAVTTTTIGELQLNIVPVGTAADQEFVDLSFTSPAASSSVDISSWTLRVNDVVVEEFFDTALVSGTPMRLCSESSLMLPGCNPSWAGEVFPDQAGVVTLVSAEGIVMAMVTYSEPAESQAVYETFGIQAELYAKRDQVPFCTTRDGATFKASKEQAVKLVDGIKGRSVVSAESIVPAFYYRFDGGMGYFAGQNYDDAGAARLANGCI